MAVDHPTTLLDAIARDLQSAAYGGGVTVAIQTTPSRTPARDKAVSAARLAFDESFADEAQKLIDYLNAKFGLTLDPAAPYLGED